MTYGLACAPYLALRCLRQLALEAEASHPLATDILLNDTYVDDVLSGASDVLQTRKKIQQLDEVLKAGGFRLRKWIANDHDALDDIPHSDRDLSLLLNVDEGAPHHTLGIQWDRQSDRFLFSVPSFSLEKPITKRSVLSFIARMFDPLGWLAPILVVAKIFMQELWAIRLDWDDELPTDLTTRWTSFVQQLRKAPIISLSRWFGTSPSSLAIEIHGFSDASQRALAAVIYVRVLHDLDDARVTLVSAKTKIAPLKSITVPRLELSAAVLLVRQVQRLQQLLGLNNVPIHLWTDSTVTLAWVIKSHPSRWKDFVKNRVALIQELADSRWHHISGKENPADLASRGISPQRLQEERLWWHGPHWLRRHSTSWPSHTPNLTLTNLEERPATCTVAVKELEPEIWTLVENYSSLTRLIRISAWIFRARDRFRASPTSNPEVLTPAELESALLFWTKITQQAYFSHEIQILRNGKSLSRSSPLLRLFPIFDSDGLLRLRGRLQHSQLEPFAKHPLILPRSSKFTTLVIDYYHKRTLHGGPQLTQSSIRQKFWIIGGRVPIRSFIHKCLKCARQCAVFGQQLLGQLPASRLTPNRPFLNFGVDYAGPLTLKTV